MPSEILITNSFSQPLSFLFFALPCCVVSIHFTLLFASDFYLLLILVQVYLLFITCYITYLLY